MEDRNFTMRLDKKTDNILDILTDELNFSRADVIRRAVRILSQLASLRDKFGQVLVSDNNGNHKSLFID